MLERSFTKSFRKDRKLMQKQGRDLSKLREVMDMIINEQPLPPHNNDHPLKGKLRKSRGCHIQGDWVLVYEIDEDARKVIFQHTDSHSNLY